MPLSGTKFLRAIIPSGDKAVRNFWALRTLKLAHRAEHLGHQSLPSAHLNPIEDQGPNIPKIGNLFIQLKHHSLLLFQHRSTTIVLASGAGARRSNLCLQPRWVALVPLAVLRFLGQQDVGRTSFQAADRSLPSCRKCTSTKPTTSVL